MPRPVQISSPGARFLGMVHLEFCTPAVNGLTLRLRAPPEQYHWTSNPISQEQVAAECRVASPRPAQASDNRTLQPARLPTTISAASEAVQLRRETTGEGLQSSEVDIEETRSSSSSGGNSSSDDDDILNIMRERLRESSDEEDNSDGSSSSNRGSRASSTRSAEGPGLQSTNHQQGGNASVTSSVAQHDGNEIQASDQHLREHHEGEYLVGGSRRSAERGGTHEYLTC